MDPVSVIPTEAELIQTVKLPCPHRKCTSIFQNAGHLQMHLQRHHKQKPEHSILKRFYCPKVSCKYNINSDAAIFFRTMQLLRQHFMKVHAEKTIKCSKCPVRFSSKSLLNVHESHCGITIKCLICDWQYGSYEALLTHCRRKKHSIPPKLSKNIQTNNNLKYKSTLMSQSKATQTTSHEINNIVFLDSWNQRASQTEPDVFSAADCSDTESNIFTTNSSVQTEINLNDLNYLGNSVENSVPYFESNGIIEENLCHSETQTDFRHSTKLAAFNRFSPMIYADTHTQTQCDEFLFGWTNIETQTNWSPPRIPSNFPDLPISTTNTDTCSSVNKPHQDTLAK